MMGLGQVVVKLRGFSLAGFAAFAELVLKRKRALGHTRAGHVLVVWKLHRLARTIKQLVSLRDCLPVHRV